MKFRTRKYLNLVINKLCISCILHVLHPFFPTFILYILPFVLSKPSIAFWNWISAMLWETIIQKLYKYQLLPKTYTFIYLKYIIHTYIKYKVELRIGGKFFNTLCLFLMVWVWHVLGIGIGTGHWWYAIWNTKELYWRPQDYKLHISAIRMYSFDEMTSSEI